MRHSALSAIILLTLAGCKTTSRHAEQPRLFDDMGGHTRPVTTDSPAAQRYFDQGLTWTFSFNHDEAIRSFSEAARLDPECAMAHWGVALCNGPHINNPAVDEAHAKAAWEALERARSQRNGASPVERDLIDALAARYAWPQPADRAPLDAAYAAAMKKIYERHPNDADVATLYAEAMMDLRPWDLWTTEGHPQPGMQEIVAVLEKVLAQHPNHPGANHLYIHAVEASPNPEKALAAAERLERLVPMSGHMVHMPSHIYVRTGKWQRASDSNVQASLVDGHYRKLSPRQGLYRMYMMHNDHFLAYACMMEGRSADAIRAARKSISDIPPEFRRDFAVVVDGYTPIVVESLMRFGKWDEILREPAPPEYWPITTAFWRFTRGVAFAAKHQVNEAEAEQARFREVVKTIPADAKMAINNAHDVLKIADLVLEAEIDFRKGKVDEAVARLRDAAAREDKLRYMEPPDWIQPVRHTLGAFLVAAERYSDAEAVYRDDLKRWPENGWALFGLAKCLRARGATQEAEQVEQRFARAWSRADTTIQSTCLCVAPAAK